MQFNRQLFPGLAPPPGCRSEPDGSLITHFTPPGAAASTYVYDPRLVLALNVALATGRPLLVAGEPGSGKTTLAYNASLVLGWASYRYTVSSRSQASELLWELDTLRRLNDAYDPDRRLLGEDRYVEPGMLWWALAPASARRRGLDVEPEDAAIAPPGHRDAGGAVLLIDEIDKAEPDVPNDLLEVLDTRSFSVRGRSVQAEREQVLVIITTNLERELPGAFMRRCVVHRLPEAVPPWFSQIAAERYPEISAALAQTLEKRLVVYRDEARRRGTRLPGTAEYLDALQALVKLDVLDVQAADQNPAWAQIERCVFGKQAQLEAAG
ncbi:MoxR family ATPase [Aquincola sp. S2]|uniref:MoxR family ATPase n=1 Tax=Pseudaquabacterium terrae TaxID=2732868 RepID=A0ABX2EAX5_9BURK|nr:MoxR family ATPase [Aquabacterium terrae]NRF65716.1 MoxR family ATPase [Aquabacterium terrae]